MFDTATTGAQAGLHLSRGMILADRYRIDEQLGEGGFGTVHRAQQIATGQHVAIKLLRLCGRDEASGMERRLARFEREMQLCAKLHHPNLVRLIDSGRTPGGAVYTVFEYVPGRTLADILAEEGPLAPEEARHLMLQVLDALACAHAEGIVHRDLKPQNIMVSHTGARRNALVLDFGLGTLTASMQGEADAITLSGEALGTPGYAAPEQLRGLDASPRADLFAWGIVFLECLSGKPVFERGAMADILYRQLGAEPIPLPHALDAHPLGDLLRRVTHKDGSQRDGDARRLLQELEAIDLRALTREELAGDGAGAPPGSASVAPLLAELPPERLLDGERRQITAVSCALAVTATERALDIEELDDLFGAGHAICATAARAQRGHIAAALGRHVLLYFGHPRAQEDDAVRAARAALAITAAIHELASRLAAEHGARLAVSIGVHTGLLVVRDPQTLGGARRSLSATATLAAQLSTRSRHGTIAVSADTQRILHSRFELEDEGPAPLDALPGATRIFRLHAERQDDAGTLVAGERDKPLAGRSQELELLLERWRRARSGAGQSFLVTGEPGIGKSRLVQEFEWQIAAEPRVVAACRCSPDAVNAALQPVVDLLHRLFELDQARDSDTSTDALEAALRRHGCKPAEMMPLLGPLLSVPLCERYAPLDVSAQRRKELVLHALLSLIFEMAEQMPVVFVVEDLHWADPTTLELLGLLVSELPSTRVLAVFTARPEFVPSFPTTGMVQVHLARLERAHAEAMVAALTGGEALPRGLLDRILERADGIPLFVEEMTRSVVEASAPGAGSQAAAEAIEIPATLRDLLMARLDRLGRARETAQIAAALGREFSIEVLAAVSPLELAAVQEDLDRLVAAELVYRKRRLREHGYLFKHALIRDAAYESMLKRSRQKVHALIARTLEERFPAIVEARPDLLARHHAAAEQHDEAVSYGIRAARAAIALSQNDEALAHGAFVMEHLAMMPAAERVPLELAVNGITTPARMARHGWGDEGVKALVERSRRLLAETGASEHRFPTLCSLVLYHHVAGNRRDARSLAEELLEAATQADDVGGQVLAHTLLGQCVWIDGNYIEGERHLSRAVTLYDPREHLEHGLTLGIDTRVWATAALGQLRWYAGETVAARESIRQAIAWAEELNIVPTLGMAHFYDALVCQYAGDKRGAGAAATRAIELAEQYGLPAIEGYCRVLRFWAEGEADAAEPIVNALDAMGCRLGLDYYASLSAQTRMERGEHAAALERVNECLARCALMDQHYYEPELHLCAAICKLHLGPSYRESARASLREAGQMARRQGMYRTEASAIIAKARHFGASGEARQRVAEIMALVPHALDGEALAFARSWQLTDESNSNASQNR